MWAYRACLLVCLVGGCASGGTPAISGDDGGPAHDAAVVVHVDAPNTSHVDAFVNPHDAPVVVDAFVPDAFVPPDAPPGALFCTTDTECGAGACCFNFGQPPGFCVAGASVFGVCLPSG